MIGRFLIFLIAGITVPAGGQSTYQIVPERSGIGFGVEHMGILTVNGVFRQISGHVDLGGDNQDSVYAAVHVETGSIDTGNRLRDRSLRSGAFLDAQKHPFIRYNGGGNILSEEHAIAEGTILLRGQPFVLKTIVEISTYQDSLNVVAEFSIRRSDADLSFESSMDPLIGDEIRIVVDIVAVRSATTSASRILEDDLSRHHKTDVSRNNLRDFRSGFSSCFARLLLER